MDFLEKIPKKLLVHLCELIYQQEELKDLKD